MRGRSCPAASHVARLGRRSETGRAATSNAVAVARAAAARARAASSAARVAASAASSRGPGAGVNGIAATQLRVVAAAVAAVGVGPRPVEHVLAVASAPSRRAAARRPACRRATRSGSAASSRCAATRSRSRAARDRNACESERLPAGERVPVARRRCASSATSSRITGEATTGMRRWKRRERAQRMSEFAILACIGRRCSRSRRLRRVRAAGRASADAKIRAPCRSRSRSSNQVLGDLRGNARGDPRGDGARPSAPARGSSSRPSCRCAAIRPKTCVLRPAFLDACARELAALAARRARHAGRRRLSRARRRPALQRARGACATAACAQVYRKQQPAELHGVRRGALFRAGQRAVRLRRRRRALSGSSSARTSGSRARRAQAKEAGAQVIVVANGSPYHTRQQAPRREQVGARARETGLPFVYVNRVGGQDELVFDGASFVIDARRRRRRSSCRRGTKRSRSSTFDGARAAAGARRARSRGSSRTSTRRW